MCLGMKCFPLVKKKYICFGNFCFPLGTGSGSSVALVLKGILLLMSLPVKNTRSKIFHLMKAASFIADNLDFQYITAMNGVRYTEQ